METQRLSQLIGLIYDSAVDLDLWPMLLQGLVEELMPDSNDTDLPAPPFSLPQVEAIDRLGDYVSQWHEGGFAEDDKTDGESQILSFGQEDDQLIRTLLPHLVRALRINRSIVELHAENRAFSSILERLPIGMAITDDSGRVYAKNMRFDDLLAQGCGLKIAQGHLQAMQRKETARLQEMIAEVARGGGEGTVGQAMKLGESVPTSLMMLPLLQDEEMMSRPKVMVFVASLSHEVDIDPKALQSYYGLSKAESRLTLALVNGSSLDEISERLHVSKHTLRTQLKSVYAKTDCRRQAELVIKVLTSPVILAQPHTQTQTKPSVELLELADEVEESRLNQFIFLRDGRRLSYAEYGPDDGYPAIMMHTITGSRLQVPPDERCLYDQGIRLIAPDRPGFGLSDSQSERTILDWARDVEELADCLDLQRFAVMGFSVGGCFAMAVARSMPQRVSRLILIGAMARYESVEDLDGIMPLFRMLLGMGRFVPAISMSFLKLMLRSVRRSPDKYYDRILEQLPSRDREILSQPAIRQHYLQSMQEAVRLGERDLMLEHLMVARDWGFSASEVEVPTTIWHGEEDRHVPVQMARTLQQQMPHARLKSLPGAGHFLMYPFWSEIIGDLAHGLEAA